MSQVAAHRRELLERVFTRIQRERMADVPILNNSLAVRWIEHGPDGDAVIGVLITPWFISLVRLPGTDVDWSELRPGDEVLQNYPSGRYRFLVNEEPDIGHFQACSLFSPVFEFADQEAAEQTATQVLAALYDESHQAAGDVDTQELVERWYPSESTDDLNPDSSYGDDILDASPDAAPTESVADPGRRGFLTGDLRGVQHR